MSFQVYRSLLRNLKLNSFDISRYHTECLRCSSNFVQSTASSPERNKMKSFDKSHYVKLERDKDIMPTGDPDVFGNLSKDIKFEKKFESMPDEEDDVVRQDFVDGKIGKVRLSTKQYADLIKKHLADKKLLDALDVLKVKMLKEDRAKPENYIYNLLIDGCARVGYTKMAFKLYNDMKKRGLKVTGATYTSLFNACALSPVQGDGLKCAHHLRELIIEKRVSLNRSNYHSMMKAFGRCGDLVTVFSIVDEMVSNNIPLEPDTFCFLLQACVTDKEGGFRHAIMVWQKMRERRVKPTIYCYNLILRCCRDCHVSDSLLLTQDLKLISADKKEGSHQKLLTSGHEREMTSLQSFSEVTNLPAAPILPNLLCEKPQLGSVVSFKQIIKPKHRLMLLGGSHGFLSQMKLDRVQPDVKTATLLLDLIPSTAQAEHELIETFGKFNIKLDIDFFNMLIKKRSMRHDYTASKEVLNLLTKYKLLPNIMTFGVLSLSCRNTKDALQFLEDLSVAGFRPNIEILGGLLCAARHSWNADLVKMIMDIVVKEEIMVSDIFLKHIERFKDFTAKQRELKEQGLPYHDSIDHAAFKEAYESFLVKYNMWLKLIKVDNRNEIHPWAQYKKSSA